MMLRFAAFLVGWLAAVPAWAFVAGQPVGMLNPQVQPANISAGLPAVDDNLAAGGYPVAGGICAEWGHQVPCGNHYAITRASTKYVNASDGIYASVPSNVLALGSGNGSLIEEARINLALWSRDLTQSGTWVAVTMTATKNAIGIDGAANSATTLTSSSAAGTILQSLTQASAAYTYTVYVKGVTVTGAIQVADYPVLTPAFTTLSSSNCFNAANVGTAPSSGQTGFLRCTVTATSLNPVIGFKFANSGDSIVVDFNQLEAGSFGTSPILTTSTTATRAADQDTAAGALDRFFNSPQGSLIFLGSSTQNLANAYLVNANGGGAEFIVGISLATVANSASGGHIFTATLGSGSFSTTSVKVAGSWNANGRSLVANNGSVATDPNTYANTTPNYVGSRASVAGSQYDGFVTRISGYAPKLPDTVLKAIDQ